MSDSDASETDQPRDRWRPHEPTTEVVMTFTETVSEHTTITVLHGDDEPVAAFQIEEGDRLVITGGFRAELDAVTHDTAPQRQRLSN